MTNKRKGSKPVAAKATQEESKQTNVVLVRTPSYPAMVVGEIAGLTKWEGAAAILVGVMLNAASRLTGDTTFVVCESDLSGVAQPKAALSTEALGSVFGITDAEPEAQAGPKTYRKPLGMAVDSLRASKKLNVVVVDVPSDERCRAFEAKPYKADGTPVDAVLPRFSIKPMMLLKQDLGITHYLPVMLPTIPADTYGKEDRDSTALVAWGRDLARLKVGRMAYGIRKDATVAYAMTDEDWAQAAGEAEKKWAKFAAGEKGKRQAKQDRDDAAGKTPTSLGGDDE